jgi:hypothetical protein
MTDAAQIADRYIAVWNETDPARRRALLAEGWTENATYVDPLMAGEGHDEPRPPMEWRPWRPEWC